MTKFQAPLFWMTTSSIDPRLHGRVTDVDFTPTNHYYGTLRVYLDYENEDPEGYGLVPWDEETDRWNAECDAVRRAEQRMGA